MRLARSNVRLLVLIAFYFLFIVIGASIFSTIEAPHENSVIRKLRAKRAAFLEEHPCVKGGWLLPSCQVPNLGAYAIGCVTSPAYRWSLYLSWALLQNWPCATGQVPQIGKK